MSALTETTGEESAGALDTASDPVTDPLADFRDAGGVRHAEYEQADMVTLSNGDEISSIALAAAGTSTEGRPEIPLGEREQVARNIDLAVRQHAAWLDSRPLMEQVRGAAVPVIAVPPAE